MLQARKSVTYLRLEAWLPSPLGVSVNLHFNSLQYLQLFKLKTYITRVEQYLHSGVNYYSLELKHYFSKVSFNFRGLKNCVLKHIELQTKFILSFQV